MKLLLKLSGVIIVLLLSYWSIKPLLQPGFYPMHDDTQVARVYDMKESLAAGAFPVRWVDNLGYGYGYPIFNFYAPLAYYVGGIFNIIGFDSLVSTKMMIGLGTVLAGVFMYLFASSLWGRFGGIISALLYVYAPYHALNIYVRGAIAELWAYAFIPLVFLGLYKLYETAKLKGLHWNWIAVTALSYAAIIVSHNLTAMMVTPFIFAYAVFLIILMVRKGLTVGYIILSLILGIMLGAFYWLPVLFEMQYTNVLSVVGGGSDYHDHFVCVSQLWNSPWAYGGSVPGCADGLSFKLGKIHIVFALLSFLPLFFMRKDKKIRTTILLCLAGLALSLFFMLPISQFVWDLVHQMAFFQFPWRFLVLASFFTSLLGGAFVLLIKNQKILLAITAIAVALTIFINYDIFIPSNVAQTSATDYTNRNEIRWNTSKISDEYMPQGFHKPQKSSDVPKEKVIVDPKDAKVISVSSNALQTEAVIQATKKTNVKLNIAYFPAWHTKLDGKKIDFKNTSTGLVVQIPEGKHTVTATFQQTPIEQSGNIVSLTGVIVLIAGIITHRKGRKKIAKSS